MLRDTFLSLVAKHTDDGLIGQAMWNEIEKSYSGSRRYYHNLQHLHNMYIELMDVKLLAEDWDTILFALFYHDIIYKATAKDNEEKSANVAYKRLLTINYPLEKVIKCKEHILATKHHASANENDTNFLLDADMAILGSEWSGYQKYYLAVRKEYSIYPDFLYNPGRIKVLKTFLAMESIFSTVHFRNKYEMIARTNLKKELEYLI